MSISYTELYEKVKKMLKPSRFTHSEGVANTAYMLARRFGVDAEAARYCGIYHDAYRYDCDSSTASFCKENGWEIFPEEEENPMLLHGVLAAIHFPVDADGVPHGYQLAVRHHTLGAIEMGKLGGVLYIADYMEPGRKHLNYEDRGRILECPSLEAMIISIMDMQKEYFVREGIKEAGVSLKLYDFLKSGGQLA